MSQANTLMQVHLRLPTRLLFSCTAKKVYAEAENGTFTLLPKHTDFVSALVPSVLMITNEEERVARTALSRLEAGIVRRFSDLRKPQT